jgi:uncharacterized repeat protein (TIGR01451 family)
MTAFVFYKEVYHMTKRGVAVLILLLLALPVIAGAQQGTLSLQSTAEKVLVEKDKQGRKTTKRVLVSDTSVYPGDEVVFTTNYENIGKDPATAVAIKNPVPEHMVYVDGSAEGKGAKIDFSVDGGKSYALPAKLKVKDQEGKERRATAADFTHIRWTLEKPLEKGKKGSVSFKATVK